MRSSFSESHIRDMAMAYLMQLEEDEVIVLDKKTGEVKKLPASVEQEDMAGRFRLGVREHVKQL